MRFARLLDHETWQLLSDSLTTVCPPTLTTSCPAHTPPALIDPVKVPLTASPVVDLPVQVTVPAAEWPDGSNFRSAEQSGPEDSLMPLSESVVVIAFSMEDSRVASNAASA